LKRNHAGLLAILSVSLLTSLASYAIADGSIEPVAADRARNRTDAIYGAPSCGQRDTERVTIPPNWSSFVPPAKGESYVDPVFGCTVVRLTDSRAAGVAEHHYYSTLSPMNADDTRILIGDEHGNRRVVDLTGNVIVAAKDMPAANPGTVLWDAKNGDEFYFTRGNSLMRGSIEGHKVKESVVHTFREYRVVVFPDKTDLSIDGDSFAMWAGHTTETGPLDIFTYNMATNVKKAAYTTSCSQIVPYVQGACVHGITQTADDNVIIGFANNGSCTECGNRLWNGSKLVAIQDGTNHIDAGYDLSGRSVFIEVGRESTLHGETNPCAGGWGLDVRRLDNLESATCLLDHQPSWHVSYRGDSAQPWVALSFFDDRKNGPEVFDKSAGFEEPSSTNWQLYEDEIVLSRIDGKTTYRLAQARSRSSESYWAQPRAAISRDGRYVIFDSNMAYAKDGCPAGVEDCADVFLIKVR
jgi:hypothetical protein